MRIAICPGSFDPITNGHLDIIARSAKMFDRVIVLVSVNADKNVTFTADERVEMVRKSTAGLENVDADHWDGLTIDYVRKAQAHAIVRGLRAVSDFEYEFQMALANKRMYAGAETVFFNTSAENMFLSSSLVKSIASHGADIKDFVPEAVADMIQNRMNKEGCNQ